MMTKECWIKTKRRNKKINKHQFKCIEKNIRRYISKETYKIRYEQTNELRIWWNEKKETRI